MNSQPAPGTLHELVYTSVASPHATGSAELQRILTGARRKNSELNITGVLLYCNGEFVQLLEGAREAVEHVYQDIIFHDPRHTGVAVAWEQPVARRSFAEWWMGFAEAGASPPSPALEGYLAGGVAGLDLSGPASTGRKLLLSIYEQFTRSNLFLSR